MRILYLHQYFNTPEMPGSTRSYEMGRRLVAAGHQVEMITSRREGPTPPASTWEVEDVAGMRVHWTWVPYRNALPYGERIKAFFTFALRASRRSAAVGGDVVFATSTPLTIALPATYAARKLRVPMVFEVRDLWPELPIAVGAIRSAPLKVAARRLERFAYANATRIIALSPDMRRGIALQGYPRDRIEVIPNSSDLELFDPRGQEREQARAGFEWLGPRPLILYAGTLGLLNGVDYLTEVAAEARESDPEIRFLVVGGGAQAERVRRRAQQLGVFQRNFFMLPPRPKKEMPALLAAADVVCSLFVDLKPMWANSANKVFDGLAAGKPIAINYGGWQADLLRESGAGLVLDPRDPAGAARLLARHVRDARWLADAGAAALRLAREQFSRDLLAERLERVLLEATGTVAGQVWTANTASRSEPSIW